MEKNKNAIERENKQDLKRKRNRRKRETEKRTAVTYKRSKEGKAE